MKQKETINQFIKKKISNIKYLPHKIRSMYHAKRFKSCGSDFLIEGKFFAFNPMNIIVGSHVYINEYVRLIVHGDTSIKIGNYVMIGPYCYIFTKMHKFNRTDIPMRLQEDTFKSIEIGNDVWIGNNVTIFPGVQIGEGSIIGSGAVVTKSIKPYSIVGGIPAKLIKSRK